MKSALELIKELDIALDTFCLTGKQKDMDYCKKLSQQIRGMYEIENNDNDKRDAHSLKLINNVVRSINRKRGL